MREGQDYLSLAMEAEDSAAQALLPALAATYRDLASSYLMLANLHQRSQQCRPRSMIDLLGSDVMTH